MAWYSRRRSQAVWQVASDLFMVAWTIGWFAVGRVVDGLISAVAEPVRATGEQARTTAGQMRDAADSTGRIPAVGDTLRIPFDDAANSLDQVVTSAEQQVAAIELTATVTGVVVFAIPFLVLLAVWLPMRIGYLRASAAGQRVADSAAGADLLALRALAGQPLHRLRAVGPDVAERWRRGDRAVVEQLAELEVRRLGLRPTRTGGAAPLEDPAARADLLRHGDTDDQL